MTRPDATIYVRFPRTEFRKIPKSYSRDLSLRYRQNRDSYCLGSITNMNSSGQRSLLLAVEIRKDETPVWYFRKILDSAKRSEILFMKRQRCLAKRGAISRVSVSPNLDETDVLYPIIVRVGD